LFLSDGFAKRWLVPPPKSNMVVKGRSNSVVCFASCLLGVVRGSSVNVIKHTGCGKRGQLRRLLSGFHAAWDFGANGREATNPDATQLLYSMYPSPVRRWIAARGGLKPQTIFLRGKQLMSMYRPCYLDAQASSPR